ncbi:MAG: hypothetical protein JWN32_343, partial [Solirubrobacterales bacterium]|nr:hypothetical protein [Solirubrobacterales bacterium]
TRTAATVRAAATAAPAEPAPGLDTATDVQPGHTYTTRLFRPTISLTVPAGHWATEQGDSRAHISFADQKPPHGMAQAIVELHRIDHVFDPRRGGRIPGDEVPLHGSFVSWLRRHPHLRVTRPRPTRLLGLPGVVLDVSTRSSPARLPGDCAKTGRHCVPLFFDGLDYIDYSDTSRGRFSVLTLPGGGELVVEEFVEGAGAFKDGLRLLRPVVRGLHLAG